MFSADGADSNKVALSMLGVTERVARMQLATGAQALTAQAPVPQAVGAQALAAQALAAQALAAELAAAKALASEVEEAATHACDSAAPMGEVDTRFAQRALTRQQQDAATNCIASSQHTKVTILPNHSLNMEGELEGFVFECSADDAASVLPLTKSSFATTAIYECLQDNGSSFQQLTCNVPATVQKLKNVINAIESSEHGADYLNFDCMPELEYNADSYNTFKDQRVWRENMPAKIGVYHCFMRTTAQNTREHKIFIVVSGYCKHASEELHNMWLDARHDITAGQFLQCAELDWLRKATLRHHSRLAARVAQGLQLHVRLIDDVNAVNNVCMLLPSTSCVSRDLTQVGNRVILTSDAALLDRCKSGVIFDCYASEGFWVFMGPLDTGSCRMFGTEFRVTGRYQAFPTRTVRYNKLFPAREKSNVVTPLARGSGSVQCVTQMHNEGDDQHVLYSNTVSSTTSFLFPHAGFVGVLSQLGFNYNDGIINLMPIAVYCDDE